MTWRRRRWQALYPLYDERHLRTGFNQRHLALQHVDELRQSINACSSEPPACTGHYRIANHGRVKVILRHIHCAWNEIYTTRKDSKGFAGLVLSRGCTEGYCHVCRHRRDRASVRIQPRILTHLSRRYLWSSEPVCRYGVGHKPNALLMRPHYCGPHYCGPHYCG
jgi:hypothetical protein